ADVSAAYVFRKSGGIWALRQTLTPSDPPQARFGSSVAISSKLGNAALVGSSAPVEAPCQEDCGPPVQLPCTEGLPCGAAYTFRE
ncbi:MAG: hypothetical protein ACREYF_05995, partial [Gammaproteobacteria bacterium]